jgi:hypothetical protein
MMNKMMMIIIIIMMIVRVLVSIKIHAQCAHGLCFTKILLLVFFFVSSVIIFCFQVEVNQDTLEPSDRLTPVCCDWVRSVGSSATTVSAILEPGDEKVLQAIQAGINAVNAKATSNAQKIQKWSLLAKDFSIPGGELGE